MNQNDMEYVNSKISELQKMLNIDEEDEIMDYNSLFEEYGIDIKQLEEDMKDISTKIELGYKTLSDGAVKPFYNYPTDSGFDLYSTEEITIDGLGRGLIPTGLCFDIPNGYEIQVRSKSGLAINQGLMVLNSPGTIDGGFTSEVKVIVFNTNKEPFTITKGMKVAQAVLSPVANGKWVDLVKKETINDKDRNSNGFGSTGLK